MLKQVSERLDALKKDIVSAVQHSHGKKAAKLRAQKEKALARKKMLEGYSPQALRKLKHEAEIAKLQKKLQPLLKMEKSFKGRMLSLKETKEMAAKDELEIEIESLEEASRGLF